MTERTKINRMLKWMVVILFTFHSSLCTVFAQGLPTTEGENIRYTAYIEMESPSTSSGTIYVSGICILHREGDVIHGSLFNEFGITALDFTYNMEKKKVKLHTVMKMMNKWYIRKVLKKDLRQLMAGLQDGQTTWKNERRHIVYQLTPLL